MNPTLPGLLALTLALQAGPPASPPADPALAARAQGVLKAHCYRCHGQDGAVEGGMNYILDRDKLLARRKVVPGQPERSPLFVRVVKGRMPPPDEKVRPSPADIEILRNWIAAGAPGTRHTHDPTLVSDAAVFELILSDLDTLDKRSRRFTRYFSLAPLANTGAGPDELQTHRHALSKLLNSLSWHPRISAPKPVDPAGLVLRIDLRDLLWDANLWNRLLSDYPYGIVHDTAVARAVLSATATRMPVVRADWFVATASRAPLYYDLLQIPNNLADLERQLRVDVAADIQQERVARAAFNGSGVSRNNRILERHDSMNGAYWRTYDFEAVPQNLLERNILLPDRRNVFAYPLGPGLGDAGFQHAGGEVIFNLPNGLHAFVIVNANNQRLDRAPTAIVSDPKRPDRAVEAGISCMHCHARGINPKDDQIRDHVSKNRKAFSRLDVETIHALYPPAAKMRALMEEDAQRFQKAVEKTGNKATSAEVVLAMTLRYEADVDLPTLAAEVGVKPADLVPRLTNSENLAKNVGALKSPGTVVSRQVVVQAFADLVKELRLGGVFQPGVTGESLPDATGEADPLEAQSSPANATAFNKGGTLAAFAANDKSVRIYDVEAARDLRRAIGHTASVWAIAFSPDGTRLLSGSKDGTVRLWDVETGRELRKMEGHTDLVPAVAFSPDGHRALSAGLDHEVILWDLDRGESVPGFAVPEVKYANAVAFAPDATRALVASEKVVLIMDARTGKVQQKLIGHAGWVTHGVFSSDGKRVLTASDDGTARLWDVDSGKVVQTFRGHESYVKSVALSPDGRQALSGGTDGTVRLWDVASGKESKVFRKHAEPLVTVAFLDDGARTLSGSRDAVVLPWKIGSGSAAKPVVPTPKVSGVEEKAEALRPIGRVSIGGTVGLLALAPDRQALICFNRTTAEVVRLDTKTLKASRLALDPATDVAAISRDGSTLVATAVRAAKEGRPTTLVQVIDPVTLAWSKKAEVPGSAYDVAVANNSLAFFTEGGAEWTDLVAVDLKKGAVVTSWAGVWARSFLQISPDSRRLYYSSQGVTPGTLDALVLPVRLNEERPVLYRAPNHDRLNLGGEFAISPDGKFLLSKSGSVLKLSGERESDLQAYGKVEPFLAAAFDVEGRSAYLLARDGSLRRYSYPEFRLVGRHTLSLAGYQLAVDSKEGRLYVAGFDPRAVLERPRDRAHGEVHVYELKELAPAGR